MTFKCKNKLQTKPKNLFNTMYLKKLQMNLEGTQKFRLCTE